MTLEEIAGTLVDNCRKGRAMAGLDELYSETAESVEAFAAPGSDAPRITKGLPGIRGKHEWWEASFVEHEITVDGPYLHPPHQFSVIFGMDVTEKTSGARMQMKEVALYTIEEGKIVREEFFAPTRPG
jgi:hypothetical protein